MGRCIRVPSMISEVNHGSTDSVLSFLRTPHNPGRYRGVLLVVILLANDDYLVLPLVRRRDRLLRRRLRRLVQQGL